MERHELNDLVFQTCEERGQPPYLAFGLIKALSHWNQNMVLYDPLLQHHYTRKFGGGSTETVLQRCRWGLFQIYGFTARKLGFTAPLTDLVYPDINVMWGVRYMADVSINLRGASLVLAFIGADLDNPTKRDLGIVQRVFRYEREYSDAAMQAFIESEKTSES